MEKGIEYEVIEELDISLEFLWEKDMGYFLIDLDGDDKLELLFGANYEYDGQTHSPIYNIFAIEDGKLVQKAYGEARFAYRLCKKDGDFVIEQVEQGGVTMTGFEYYSYKQNLEHIETVLYDAQSNSENPWFYSNSEENRTPITSERAEQIKAGYEEVEIPFIRIKDKF